ncbi:methyl-accepting chemotaxis protein [Massilia forsythiae]|uniref:methyl-accepting chemotaxis protein n=1 Tax=Massilia forsythiae TaxID=2728020 RepID=UPI0028038068|nr:methyl-accepting chemotaxis protein [Massilia forsythiae]
MSQQHPSSVRRQLWWAFAVVIVLSFLSTTIAVWRLQALADDMQALTQRPLVKERLISGWMLNISVAAKRTALVARSADGELARLYADEARESSARTNGVQKQVGDLLDSDEEKAVFQEIATLRQHYTEARDRVMALKTDGKSDEAKSVFENTFVAAMNAYVAKVKELLTIQQKAIDARSVAVLDSAARSTAALVALCLATLVFSMAAGALFGRSLFRRLGGEPAAAAAVAAEIARGNLRVEVPLGAGTRAHGSYADGASLMAALEHMRASLADIVGQVRHGATAIGTGIGAMAGEAQDLSRRTESQAAALEETASSMEQLTQAINNSASSAEQANRLAAAASLVAQQGGAMVGQLVDTMGAINESSTRIVDIIAVIDGIAFQTNILALNAAVEAARAGEQGRGFAVVASEVRALAQRSASAAREIKGLIDASTQRIAGGSALAGQAGETMHGIVESIDRVSGIMSEILASSREQASGIGQINQAIGQMDGMTQQNAALVEASAGATRSMQQQAAQLSQLVALFQVDGATRPAARAASRPAPARAAASASSTPDAPAAAPRALPSARPTARDGAKAGAAAAVDAAAAKPAAKSASRPASRSGTASGTASGTPSGTASVRAPAGARAAAPSSSRGGAAARQAGAAAASPRPAAAGAADDWEEF